jgi:hypothetical protein
MTAYLSPAPKLQFFYADGTPLVGGLLYSYAAGTTTPLATYTTADGSSANTNPIVLDSRGEANVWLGNADAYKLTLKTPTGDTIWTVDNISSVEPLIDAFKVQLAAPSGASLIGFIANGASNPSDARTVQTKLREIVSVKDFGATGDGVTNDRADIQAAIDQTAGNAQLYFPAGTYLIDEALQWKSGSYLVGSGIDLTIIKLSNSADINSNVLEPEDKNGGTEGWGITQMTLDGNYQRFGSGSLGDDRPGGTCLATMSAKQGVITQVKTKNAILHGVDVCNGGEVVAGQRYYVAPANQAPNYYPTNESENIWLDEIYSENAGDDAFTGHYSKNIFIGRVYCTSTGGRHPDPEASNCFEVDDGCRLWRINQITSTGGNRGLAIKVHTPEPSPIDIMIGTLFVSDCRQGLYIDGHATSFAQRITINSVIVTDPVQVNQSSGSAIDIRAIVIQNAKNVTINAVIAEATGSESFALDSGILVSSSSTDVSIVSSNIKNWPYNNTATTTIGGVVVSSTCSRVSFNEINLVDCGFRGVVDTGSSKTSYGSVFAELTSAVTGSVAVRFVQSPKTNQINIGPITEVGYATATSYDATDSTTIPIAHTVSGWWVDGFITAGQRNTPITTYHQFNNDPATTANTEPTAFFTANQTEALMQVFARGTGGSFGANAAAAVVKVGTSATTGRSINAGGTVNASGADYAEYMVKRDDCGIILKGQICGVDANGMLTDMFELAHSFVIKSTSPAYVGGDIWAQHLQNRPEKPLGNDVAEEVLKTYEKNLAEFEAELELARQKVDRIAFCGRVPCRIEGSYSVGDYVIAQPTTSGHIKAIAASKVDFENYALVVGKIWGLTDDSPTVAVKIV